MKILAAILALAFPACQVTMPIGDRGQYGEVFIGYRLPAMDYGVFNSPTLGDK